MENDVDELRKKIKLLRRLPKDFRDITVGSQDWLDFAKAMGPEKENEMHKWANGGVLSLAPLSHMEEVFFKDYEWVKVVEWDDDWDSFFKTVSDAEADGASFVYAPQLPRGAVNGLNALASHCGLNLRFRAVLVDERGRRLGISW